MKLSLIPPLLACAALLGQCSNQIIVPEGSDPKPVTELGKTEKEVVKSGNEFGLKLMRTLNAGEADKNMFISPLSVSMALGMTLNGAAGSTRDDMARTLELAGLSDETINGSYRNIIDLLENLDPSVKFRIANSIWSREGFPVEQTFTDVNRKSFDAEISSLDFNRPDAARIINSWVEGSTNGKIKEIVKSPIGSDVVMYLINAIYFKGVWTTQFDKKQTREAPFRGPNGSQSTCNLMYLHDSLRCAETGPVKVVELPYGKTGYSMVVALPNEGVDINSLVGTLTPAVWSDWTDALKRQEAVIQLPRFKVEYEVSLNDALKALGMGIAFGGGADFSRISRSGGLMISEVKHKTFVEVNEEGTEAAAVTSVEMVRTSLPMYFTMRCDRPFLFAIRENSTGTILFAGKIMRP